MPENKPARERFFSVELKSKANFKNITLTNGSRDSALIEGTIGELQRCCFAEGVILEVVGSKGVLRVDLQENEIKKPLKSRQRRLKKNC